MTIWFDGARTDELTLLRSRGFIRGVTTNLTMVNSLRLSRGKSRIEVLRPISEICAMYDYPLSIQVEAQSVEGIITEALWLRDEFPENFLYIKIPVNSSRLEAINRLKAESIRVNATCVTSYLQAILALEAGAEIISFFVGKMSDQGIDPWLHVSEFRKYIDRQRSVSKILCGSFRQTEMLMRALCSGADIITVPFEIINKAGNQLQSDEATSIFMSSLEGLV
jgi:TalC/MipB family fructose-6-phosphate aldolase